MSSTSANESNFWKACEYVTEHHESLPFEALALLYGYYKQATVGPCYKPQPSFFEIRARKMWKSWSKLGDMSKACAQQRYVELLDELASSWRSSVSADRSGGWARVSSPDQEEAAVPDSAKNVFDWVKEGDLQRLRDVAGVCKPNLRDEHGLTLLHWAADRGHLPIVEYLVAELGADVNCVDNEQQTPLHYAASCGYLDICRFLVDSEAEVMAKDSDGLAPADVAEEAPVRELLKGLQIV